MVLYFYENIEYTEGSSELHGILECMFLWNSKQKSSEITVCLKPYRLYNH